MSELSSSPAASSLALMLIHFIWQGCLAGLIYWLLMAALDLRSARARYAISLSALLAMGIVPIVTFSVVHQSQLAASTMSQAGKSARMVASAEPGNADRHLSRELPHDVTSLQLAPQADQDRRTTSGIGLSELRRVMTISQPYILVLWLAGVLLSGARLAAGLASVVWFRAGREAVSRELLRHAKQAADHMGLGAARVFASERVRVAAVSGFLKPVVLLPASWLCAVPPEVLHAVIAHELAHIRRLDVWVNLLQRVLETLLFFHPVVWWLSNRVRCERELCCDELAVQATGDRGRYVIALEQVGRLTVHGGRSFMPAVTGGSKMNLLNRIHNILGVSRRPHRDPSWLAGVLAVGCSVAIALAIGVHSHSGPAFAQERDGGSSPEAEAGQQRSPEAEAGPRRSAEGKERRSPEARSGRRRSAEEVGDERAGRSQRDGEGRTVIDGFEPQTPREKTLLQMIRELQREVDTLRREMRSRSRGDGDVFAPPRNIRRDGDVRDEEYREGDKPVDANVSFEEFELPLNWERTREGRVFRAYDKNGDKIVSLDEWLAMTNGNSSPERREISEGHFNDAEPSGDGQFTPAEFVWWRKISTRRRAEERDRARRVRDGEGPVKDGPRDGEGPAKTGPRDGDAAGKSGPRDDDGASKIDPRDRDEFGAF